MEDKAPNVATIEDLQDPRTAVAVPTSTDISAASAAAYGKSMVEARYVMAMRNRRVWDQVRTDILAECKRPAFAHNKSAYYIKPIGDGVEGLGIRFAEVALRCMTNVLVESPMVYENEKMEVHRVIVTDVESNTTYTADVRVSKYVERSKPDEEGHYLSRRKNSWGKWVYLVPGTDDDLLNKRGALISKAVRTLALRIIPGDIQDEAETVIKGIREDKAARDPTAERKSIADAFADIGVRADALLAYLGHDLSTCSPPELVKLRGLYGAIRDGETTWAAVMQNKEDGKKPPPQTVTPASVAPENQVGDTAKAAADTSATPPADAPPPEPKKRKTRAAPGGVE
jgi:hypothetical protein